MRIREYTPEDLNELRRLHSTQGFGYPFPDLESPLFLTKLVLEDDASRADTRREASDGDSLSMDDGPRTAPRIAMAVLLRLTAEAYLLHDPAAGSPRLRWERFLALHDAAKHDARSRGLDDVQAFLPSRVARAFGRRLGKIGWVQDPWACFTRSST